MSCMSHLVENLHTILILYADQWEKILGVFGGDQIETVLLSQHICSVNAGTN